MHNDPIEAANKANNKGIDELLAENYAVAKDWFESSLRIFPDNHIAIKNLAAIAAKLGALEEAGGYLLRLQEKDHTASSLFNLAKIMKARNQLDKAKLFSMKAYGRDSDDVIIKSFYADIEYRIGDKLISRRLNKEILLQNPFD